MQTMKYDHMYPCVSSLMPLHNTPPNLMSFPSLDNPLSSVSVAYMHMGIWSPTGAGDIYQWAHHLKATILQPPKLATATAPQ